MEKHARLRMLKFQRLCNFYHKLLYDRISWKGQFAQVGVRYYPMRHTSMGIAIYIT